MKMFKTVGNKILLLVIFVTLLFFVNESVSADVIMYGDSMFFYNNGLGNISFIDSGVTLRYFEFNSADDYVILDDIMLRTSTTNLLDINISQINSGNGTGMSIGTTVLRFNASCIGGDVGIVYIGNITRGMYDVYSNNVLVAEDIGRGNFKIGFSSWSDKDIDIKFAGVGAPMPFVDVNWSNISGNWSEFILSGYKGIFGNWTYPLIFLGIIGYVYAINRSAVTAAALICIIFGVFGVTDIFATSSTASFSLLSWVITIVSFAALFVTLFMRRRNML